MKQLFYSSMIFSAFLALSACGTNDSAKENGKEVASVRNEKITCNTSTVIKYKHVDGSETRYLEESIDEL